MTYLRNVLVAERAYFPLWFPIAFGIGILGYFARTTEPDPSWTWLPLGLLIVTLTFARRQPILAWILGLAAMAALGFVLALWHARLAPPPMALPSRAVEVQGLVLNVEALPQGLRLTLAEVMLSTEASAQPRSLRIRLRQDDTAKPEPGDRVRLRALLRPPAPPAYPGAWDFQRAAFFSGQGGAGFAIGPADTLPQGGVAPPFAALRRGLERKVLENLPGPAGAISAALLTGGQSAIPAADLAAMRDSGLAHLLSVSGLHIAIVMSLTFWVCRLLLVLYRPLALRLPVKVLAGGASLLSGGFYMLLTGSQVPMQRSFAMACLVTLAILTGRRAISLRNLAWAAIVVMALDPVAILGPSFQMSFAAVLALITGWEAARPYLHQQRSNGLWPQRILLPLMGLLLTSLLAGAATTPFGLAHFGRLQWYGVAANALAVPLTSFIIMPAGMAAALLMPLQWEAAPLWVMGLGVEGVLQIARHVAAWSGATQILPTLPLWGLGIFSFGFCWLCLWRASWRWLGLLPMIIGLSSNFFHVSPHVLISGDARLIAFVADSSLFLQRQSGASSLTRDTWLRLYGLPHAESFPAEGAVAGGSILCAPEGCRLAQNGGALLHRAGSIMSHCGQEAVIIAAEPIRERCRRSIIIDRFSVWRDGPHAIWLLPNKTEVISDRAWRGTRPWVPPPPQPRPAQEPPAPTE